MKDIAVSIVKRLRDAGFTTYFAGGCVRDLLLTIDPTDFDIATSATPDQVCHLFDRTIEVGAHFGVIIVVESGMQFEIASFRADGIYLDGRHPETISFSTPEQDAARRDFTINGMFFDPLTNQLIDYVGGQKDLQAGVLRAIGCAADRFQEDRLRLMRTVRFAARFDFTIDAKTWDALVAQSATILAVSPERIRDELCKIFLAPSRVAGLDLLDRSGLLTTILPEVAALHGCEQPPQFHPEGDVFIHTRIMLDLLEDNVSLPLVFGVLFHDIGKPPTYCYDKAAERIRFNGHDRVGAEMTEAIMHRLRFSNLEIEETCVLVANHMIFKDVQKMRVAKLRRFMARPTFDDEIELHRVDCQSSHGMLDNHVFVLAKQKEFANEPLIPPPLLSGRDLIALGCKPGPQFRIILDIIQTKQLEGSLTSSEEALQYIRANYPAGT